MSDWLIVVLPVLAVTDDSDCRTVRTLHQAALHVYPVNLLRLHLVQAHRTAEALTRCRREIALMTQALDAGARRSDCTDVISFPIMARDAT
jgi:hypothetical protein